MWSFPIPGHQPHQRRAGGAVARDQVSRGVHQESLHRPHLHHAGAGTARQVGAQQTQCHRSGISRQERAAGRRFHRARHDLARKSSTWRARPARGKFFSLRQHLRFATRTFMASTCRMRPNSWQRDIPTKKCATSSARIGSSIRTWKIWSMRSATTTQRSRTSILHASRANM